MFSCLEKAIEWFSRTDWKGAGQAVRLWAIAMGQMDGSAHLCPHTQT